MLIISLTAVASDVEPNENDKDQARDCSYAQQIWEFCEENRLTTKVGLCVSAICLGETLGGGRLLRKIYHAAGNDKQLTKIIKESPMRALGGGVAETLGILLLTAETALYCHHLLISATDIPAIDKD